MLREASLVSPANAMQHAVIRSNEFNSMFLLRKRAIRPSESV